MAKVFRNAEAERRIQERLYAAIARSHEGRIEKALRAQYSAGARAFVAGHNVDTAIKNDPSRGKLKDSLTGLITSAYIDIGGRVRDAFRKVEGKSMKRVAAMDPAFQAALDAYVETYMAGKVVQISQATRDQIAVIVNNGIRDGLSIAQIAAQIRDDGKLFSKYRAFTIARTESHSAANSASLDQAIATGVVKQKEWIAVHDDRTRDGVDSQWDHIGITPVDASQPFDVSGEELMYPGDPSGSAGNIINCRCALTYEV